MRSLLVPVSVCLLLPLLFALPGCDRGTPVAPAESSLTISANPSQIAPTGSSNIRVVARKGDGLPVNPGTQIFFSTTLGTIEPSVATDSLGVANATLLGDGRSGTATVTALSGAAEAVLIDVEVGFFNPAASITLQATPTTVNEETDSVELLSLVRDESGQLLPDAAVNFLTEIGTLASGGAAVFTGPDGAATDTLTLGDNDLSGVEAETFAVRAQTAAAGGLLIEAVFDVAIRRLAPEASFEAVDAGVCVVAFTNTSTGENLDFEWDFDGDGTIDSSEESPSFDYSSRMSDTDGDGEVCPDGTADMMTDESGVFTVTLTAENDFGTDSFTSTVTVAPN